MWRHCESFSSKVSRLPSKKRRELCVFSVFCVWQSLFLEFSQVLLIPWSWRSSMVFDTLMLCLCLTWDNKKLPRLCLLGPQSSKNALSSLFLLADLTQSSTGSHKHPIPTNFLLNTSYWWVKTTAKRFFEKINQKGPYFGVDAWLWPQKPLNAFLRRNWYISTGKWKTTHALAVSQH